MHWKKLVNPDYLGAYSLEHDGQYRNKVVTIESVKNDNVIGSNGKSEQCVVIALKGEKPMIANRTNLKTIEKVAATPDTDKWKGLRIELTVKRVKAFGDEVDALRVIPTPPEKPELTPSHPKWSAAKKAVQDGQTTVEKIRNTWKLNEDNAKLLTDEN